MGATLNENWDMARRRFDAFWQREIIDRPCLSLTVRRQDLPPVNLPPVSPEQYWSDPETFYRYNAARFSHTLYLGEAFPVVYSCYGGLAAMQGCQQFFDADTVWTRPLGRDLRELEVRLDRRSPILQRMMAIVEYAAREGHGQCLVSYPGDMGNRGDTLAKMRGYSELCLDLAEQPERVAALERQILDCWRELCRLFHDLTRPYTDGTCTMWLPIWCRGRAVLVEADIIGLISRRHLQEVYLPTIVDMVRFGDRSIFHLDGPGAVRHLDTLLDIAELDGIQWEPGEGSGPMVQWMDLFRRIQARGKCICTHCDAQDAEELLANISPRGLILNIACDSEETARGIIKLTEHLSARRKW